MRETHLGVDFLKWGSRKIRVARYSQSQVDLLRQLLRGSCEKKVEPRQHVLWLKKPKDFFILRMWGGSVSSKRLRFPECRKIHHFLRFSKTGRLRCNVATLRTPSKRLWGSLESLEEIRVLTFRWENRMKGDFCKWEGEFSEYLVDWYRKS